MTLDFRTFVEELSKKSNFDRNVLRKIYEKKLQVDHKGEYAEYERRFVEDWDGWVKINGKMRVSEFFVEYGERIFRNWLQAFFPFYTGTRRLIIGVKAGGTIEDVIIDLFYRFSVEELESVNRILEGNSGRISCQAALTRIFLESLLAIRPIISKALGYQYSLMIEESKFLKKDNGRILFLEIVARPSE